MKFIGKLLGIAMVGEGIVLCVAPDQYLQMWANVFGGMSHWRSWFEDHDSTTRTFGAIEVCCGLLLLNKTR